MRTALAFLILAGITAGCARHDDGMGDLFKGVGMVYGNDPYRRQPCAAPKIYINNVCRLEAPHD